MISNGSPGAAAPGSRRQLGATDVKRLNRTWRRRTRGRLSLLLESVGQPFNVGSIIRTAAALGVDQLWLCGDCATPEHPSARKTSLGTGRFLPWEQLPDAAAGIAAARAAGLRVIAVELASGAVPLHEAPLAGDVCLALGNEDRGCSAGLLAAADAVAYIPQAGRVGSLNVAAAAAIALAEARRREWAGLAELPAADLAGTDLAGTDPAGTDLAGTDLAGAYPAGTDPAGAYPAGADVDAAADRETADEPGPAGSAY